MTPRRAKVAISAGRGVRGCRGANRPHVWLIAAFMPVLRQQEFSAFPLFERTSHVLDCLCPEHRTVSEEREGSGLCARAGSAAASLRHTAARRHGIVLSIPRPARIVPSSGGGAACVAGTANHAGRSVCSARRWLKLCSGLTAPCAASFRYVCSARRRSRRCQRAPRLGLPARRQRLRHPR